MQPKPHWKLLPRAVWRQRIANTTNIYDFDPKSEHLNKVTFKHSFLWHSFTKTPTEPLTKDNLFIQPLQLQASVGIFQDHRPPAVLWASLNWSIPLFLQSPLHSVSAHSQRRLFKGTGGKRIVLPQWTKRGCEEAEVIPVVWPSNSFYWR